MNGTSAKQFAKPSQTGIRQQQSAEPAAALQQQIVDESQALPVFVVTLGQMASDGSAAQPIAFGSAQTLAGQQLGNSRVNCSGRHVEPLHQIILHGDQGVFGQHDAAHIGIEEFAVAAQRDLIGTAGGGHLVALQARRRLGQRAILWRARSQQQACTKARKQWNCHRSAHGSSPRMADPEP